MISATSPTVLTVEQLLRIREDDPPEFERQATFLVKDAIQKQHIWTVYRLARELQHSNHNLQELEDFIVGCDDPFFILRYARDVKTANVSRLQAAIIGTRRMDYIAEFGCFVAGANLSSIEDLMVQYKNPRGAYLILSYAKKPNVDKLRPIILKSKRPRYLYCLAKFSRDQEEVELIQDLILKGKSLLYVRLFCTHIKGANLKKCEDRVLQSKDVNEVRKFIRYVKSERLEKLLLLV